MQASSAGWARALHLLRLPHVDELLGNTVKLVVLVTPLCAVIGAGTAWLLERTDLPGRRFWAVLLALPLAVPEFVNGFAWVGLDDRVHGLGGAVLVSTLSYYPLVMLPAIASLRRADTALEDVARSQGLRSLAVFTRVTLPQLRLALLGGGLIIALHLLAEYGAFALLGFRTFTTRSTPSTSSASTQRRRPCSRSCWSILPAATGRGIGPQGRTPPTSETTARCSRSRLGRRVVPAFLALGTLAVLALGVPLGALAYWLIAGSSTTLPSASIMGRPSRRSDSTGGGADHDARGDSGRCARGPLSDAPGAPARAQRVPRARHAGPDHRAGARLLRRAPRVALYQSPVLLVTAYAVLFFPLALIAIRPSVAQASPRLEEAARSLGQPPLAVSGASPCR